MPLKGSNSRPPTLFQLSLLPHRLGHNHSMASSNCFHDLDRGVRHRAARNPELPHVRPQGLARSTDLLRRCRNLSLVYHGP